MNTENIKLEIDSICKKKTDINTALQSICDYLEAELKTYTWVGFYFKNGDKPELKLSKYTGEETDHTIIPFGKGICGQVALSNKNFVVDDVKAQDNYIACNIHVKSEIVIPMFKNGENIGQLDIDSNIVNAFDKQDEEILEYICKKVSELEFDYREF